MTRFHVIWIGAVLAALSAAAAPEYWPIDLGTLGGAQSAALGLNDNGQVVGWSLTADGAIEAFVWSNGTLTGLGFLPGGTTSVARAINNHGQITGDAYVSPTNYHGFVYSNGLMTSIGTWGSAKSRPRAINDQGELAGSSPPPTIRPLTMRSGGSATSSCKSNPPWRRTNPATRTESMRRA
ncbi:MAG TPA: hypothetical protein PL011_01370 [Kiritimatiellia bacterium]|nr:hypothetical protein [Kiritimatiellia bacterium]